VELGECLQAIFSQGTTVVKGFFKKCFATPAENILAIKVGQSMAGFEVLT